MGARGSSWGGRLGGLAVADGAVGAFAVACILLDVIFGLSGYQDVFELPSVACVLALSVVLCYRARRNALLFLLSLVVSYANYSAMVANYSASYALRSGYDSMYQGTWVASEGTFVLLLFMAVVVLFLPKEMSEVRLGGFFERYAGRHSVPVVLLVLVILVANWYVNSSGFAATGGRGTANQLFEYSYLLFMVAFYYSGKREWLRLLTLAVILLYVAQNVLTGNRAGILALVMLVYALYFADRWPVSRLLPAIAAGFLAFMVVGSLRQNLVSSMDEVPSALAGIAGSMFVWDTSSYAYHQSLAFVRLSDLVGGEDLPYLIRQWVMSIFLGASAVPDSSLSAYAQRFFPGMGGGFLPFYFYFYFGVVGIVASGLIVAVVYRAINGLSHENSVLGFMVRLALFMTCFRWYLYSPAPLTRGVLLALLLGGFALLFDIGVKSGKSTV